MKTVTEPSPRSRAERLRAALHHAAHHLPSQGPIAGFVHHNTLHAFQHLPFEDAVVVAGRVFGAEPFMPVTWYHARYEEGRIDERAVERTLTTEGDERIFPGGPRRRRWLRALLDVDAGALDDAAVRYALSEGDALLGFPSALRDERHFRHVSDTQAWADRDRQAAIALLDPEASHAALLFGADDPRRRGGAEALAELDRDPEAMCVWLLWCASAAIAAFREPRVRREPVEDGDVVSEEMQRLLSAFLDQGMAYWPMPSRARGFYAAVRDLFCEPLHLDPPGLSGARAAFSAQRAAGESAEEVALRLLDEQGYEEEAWSSVLEAELFAMPGWAGMMHLLETSEVELPVPPPPCSLLELVAVRLTFRACERQRRARVAPSPATLAGAYEVFECLLRLGWSPVRAAELSTPARAAFARAIDATDDIERRRLWHLAYERQHRESVLGALVTHRATIEMAEAPSPPAFQVFFCIDDREESIRRHLEELGPRWQTFGAAGFYGLAIRYLGADDAHATTLCPVAVSPPHIVKERAVAEHDALAERRALRRRLAAATARAGFVGSRGLVRAWLLTAGFGLLSMLPLSFRVLFPGLVSRMVDRLGSFWLPEPHTELVVERVDGTDAGLTLEEKVDKIAAILVAAGLTSGFAPVVGIIGHGSSSLNNPHEAAHDCGACGGGRGGPNARLFALIANEPEVRAALSERGIDIPDTTWFVGGYHDTCNDAIVYYDRRRVPEAHRARVDELVAGLEEARTKSAHERCRVFEWAPHGSAKAALRHVEARSQHLAEPRPEYGHATNALCIVGRRALTRGLFLDRRAFLVSYDPTRDEDGRVLGPLLASMGPVGAGINLEYYFSFVDNQRYGCGTKLPHNLAGLLGVMDGHASDLRTGLPWQMVEIHEPVRLLCIVESTPEAVLAVAARYPAVEELVVKRWIQLATIDPSDGRVHVFEGGSFAPFESRGDLPEVATSLDFYRGRTGRLPVARIRDGLLHGAVGGSA